VKPLTTGYRLALSYNLIHTSPGVPRPTLPDMHTGVSTLRDVLRKWSHGKYADEPETKFVAYLLKHRYNEVNLKMTALKGEDAHKISHLRDVAEELGFIVCLANVSYSVLGVPDDPHCGYWRRKRARYNYESEDSEVAPSMGDIIDSSLNMEKLVDLMGRPLISISGRLPLNDENLIPENPFEDLEPDETEYEGYTGNVRRLDYFLARQLTHLPAWRMIAITGRRNLGIL
jgi:hypothetical protein